MKIRLIQHPSVSGGVLQFVRTCKESIRTGELHDGWNLNGSPGNPFVHVPLSAADFATAEEAECAARDGFDVAERSDALLFAQDLIENGWAVEVTN